MPARRYRGLLAIVVFLIAYGSLYPFQFIAVPNYQGFLAMPLGRGGGGGGVGGNRKALVRLKETATAPAAETVTW